MRNASHNAETSGGEFHEHQPGHGSRHSHGRRADDCALGGPPDASVCQYSWIYRLGTSLVPSFERGLMGSASIFKVKIYHKNGRALWGVYPIDYLFANKEDRLHGRT